MHSHLRVQSKCYGWLSKYKCSHIFLILCCADVSWEEFSHTINKLNHFRLSDEELKSYQELCNLLNNSPVLVRTHFQYKVEVIFQRNHI